MLNLELRTPGLAVPLALAVLALAAVAAGACAPAPTPPLAGAFVGATTVEDLVADLSAAGFELETVGKAKYIWFDAPGHTYTLGDGGRDALFVHEHADAAAARAAARRVAPDGESVIAPDGQKVRVQWLGDPHVFVSGPLLVVYVGSDATAARALEEALGQQFAGAPPP